MCKALQERDERILKAKEAKIEAKLDALIADGSFFSVQTSKMLSIILSR